MSAPVQPVVHTPGPWSVTPKYFDEHGEALMQIECESHMIGEIYVCDGAEGEANARLIAAAPDLLEACKMYLRAMDEYGHHDKTDRLMRAAIEKATGEVV